MLFAAAARLALIECLCPTAALEGTIGFPTLAGRHVLDSRRVALDDLDSDQEYTPVLGLFSAESSSVRRGDLSDASDRLATTTIEIIAEMAIRDSADGTDFADAMASTDANSELLLSTLVAQICYIVREAPAGSLFRKVMRGMPLRITAVPDVMPEMGVRFARQFITIEIETRDDCYSAQGGLPEPLASLQAALPSNSYAASQLVALASSFPAISRDDFDEFSIKLTGRNDVNGGSNFS